MPPSSAATRCCGSLNEPPYTEMMRETIGTAGRMGRPAVSHHDASCKSERLPIQAAALSAARAAARDRPGVLLLAGRAGRVAVVPAAGRLRPLDRVRLVRELPRAVQPAGLFRRRSSTTFVFSIVVAVSSLSHRAAARGDGGQAAARRHDLPHAADLALCGGAASPACCGCSCSSPRSACWRAPLRCIGIDWNPLLNGNQAMIAGRHRRGLEADQLQFPVLPRRPAGDSRERDRGAAIDGARRCGASGPSMFPLLSPTTSSCSSSTSSTSSSTPSASSTR